jgi:SAM-dependent methyltransferase
MSDSDHNAKARDAWNANAAFWDERMGAEGNDFVNVLLWPPTERLLAPRPGERVLDIACGTGIYARRLAALGAEVVACDFAAQMIEAARRRAAGQPGQVTFHVLDATDEAALLTLGEGSFDGALCQMALMDMAEIDPLMRAMPRLLRPGGRFVFSVTHPCFNNASAVHVGEMEDRDGSVATTYAVKVSRYMTASVAHGLGIVGQPKPQLYFDRPLHMLLGAAFSAGLVLDALEERSFPPDHPAGRFPLGWSGRFSEIPPVLVARLRVQ